LKTIYLIPAVRGFHFTQLTADDREVVFKSIQPQ
jgi:hypothetical protein